LFQVEGNMKSILTLMFRISLGLLLLFGMPVARPAQAQKPTSARYTLRDIGTLGGSDSFAYAINSSGMVAGGANTRGQTDIIKQPAFLWYGGKPINLGTLSGSNCPDCSSEGSAVAANGSVAMISETATLDPNGEDFCEFGTGRQ